MKKLIVITIIGVGVYFAYQNRETLQVKWVKIAHAAVEPDTPIVATPAPVETPAPITVVAESANSAPNPFVPKTNEVKSNWYYLLVRKSVDSNDGVKGFPPGSMVYYIAPGQFRTRSGELLLEVAENQVTQDVNVARKYANIDVANQAALQAQLKKEEQKMKSVK